MRLTHKIIMSAVLILACLLFSGQAGADTANDNPWAHSFYFENDLFTGTDSNYTNGVKYSLISPDLSPRAKRASLPRKALELIHKIPYLRDSGPADAHYQVRPSEDGTLWIEFGDGRNGRRLPTGGNNVLITYRQGVGAAGNLPAGSLLRPVHPHPRPSCAR